ncbi:hypothetical protein Tco_0993374 [Tanacetum coccineum]|uniref:Uncharacterized protein n=1 Tax=Tanacetum coccineum TaxID=301880 RepID=A0ABQ5F604_9ASTR
MEDVSDNSSNQLLLRLFLVFGKTKRLQQSLVTRRKSEQIARVSCDTNLVLLDFPIDPGLQDEKRLSAKLPTSLGCSQFFSRSIHIRMESIDWIPMTSDDMRFTSQAWNRLFRIKEQVVREYVMEFLSSFTFRDHIEALDEADTMVF